MPKKALTRSFISLGTLCTPICEHIYIHICINLSFIVYSKIHSPKCPLFLQYRLKYFSHRAFCNVCGETVSGLFPRALRCNGMKYFAFWKTRVRCLHVLYFVTTYSALPDRSDTIIKCDRFPRLLCCVDTPLFFFFPYRLQLVAMCHTSTALMVVVLDVDQHASSTRLYRCRVCSVIGSYSNNLLHVPGLFLLSS